MDDRVKRQNEDIQSHIIGNDLQLLEVELRQGQTVIAEAGAMTYMGQGIEYEARLGDGSKTSVGVFSKLMSAGKRILAKESLFLTHFTNTATIPASVGLASPYPGSILTLDMWNYKGPIYCQKGAFLAANKGTRLSISLNKKVGSGFFGGEGFILQKIEGTGQVFLHAGGCIQKKTLKDSELMIDTGCLVAFTSGIDYDVELIKDVKSMFFGGEGLFLTTLSGTGMVWIQSLPFSRLADRVIQYAPKLKGRKRGEQ